MLDARYSRAYTYDDMNRLIASVTGPAANAVNGVATATLPSSSATPSPSTGVGLWGTAVYQYDRMGNMTAQQVGPRVDNFRYSGTTSKLTDVEATSIVGGQVAYDAAGNETAVGFNSYKYSARNEMISAGGPTYANLNINPISAGGTTTAPLSVGNPWTYKYDGFGTRLSTTINQVAPTVANLAIFTQPTRYSIPGPDGQLVTETSTAAIGTPEYDYVWMDGKPIAQIDAVNAGRKVTHPTK